MNAIELAKEIEEAHPLDLNQEFIAAELRRLHAENEALKKDAERYRLVRSEESEHEIGIATFKSNGDILFIFDENADCVIDKAIGEPS